VAPQSGKRLLIVGYGSIGRRHLTVARAVMPDLAAVLLRRPGGGAEHPDAEVVHDLAAAIAAAPDLAIVATPAPFHVEAAAALIEADIPVLVEKPLAASVEGVPALLRAARERAVPLLLGYCLRHDPAFAALRAALPRVGPLVSARAEVGQYLPDWRPGTDYRCGVSARAELGGGALLELSHEIDLLRALLGEARSVSAALGRAGGLEIDVEDSADLVLRFDGGPIATAHLDMVQRAPVRTLRLAGRDGTLEWDGIARTSRLFDAAAGTWRVLHEGGDGDAMYRAQFEHFLACAAGESKPEVTGLDGLRVLEIVAAARVSAHAGREISIRSLEP